MLNFNVPAELSDCFLYLPSFFYHIIINILNEDLAISFYTAFMSYLVIIN